MNRVQPNAAGKFPCPCCGYHTLSSPDRGSYDLCRICNWEDDDVQWRDPDYEGGANTLSLRQARSNFERSLPSVRPPNPDELPRHRWPA